MSERGTDTGQGGEGEGEQPFLWTTCCCEAVRLWTGVNTAPGKAQGLTLCQNRCAFGQEV
ncbi:hypothetical protein NQZ68_018966 [Dissostichus eleginoides]|nr:hypothetical protein NQZ68_018966 [Dissostichus eleginoides]